MMQSSPPFWTGTKEQVLEAFLARGNNSGGGTGVESTSSAASGTTVNPLLVFGDQSDLYWSGDTAGDMGPIQLVFKLQRAMVVSAMRYVVMTSEGHAPAASVLEVAPCVDGPWERVIGWCGSAALGPQVSPVFAATGAAFRWTIATANDAELPVHLRSVEFQTLGGGIDVEIFSEQIAELTVTSETLKTCVELMRTWTRPTNSNKGPVSSENGAADSHSPPNRDVAARVLTTDFSSTSTHDLENLTGFPVAVSKTLMFDPADAIEVAPLKIQALDFTTEGSRNLRTRGAAQPADQTVPITHLDVIDTARRQVPKGWKVIRQDLSHGQARHSIVLMYKRSLDSRPVTDLHLRLGAGSGTFIFQCQSDTTVCA